jgi:hypothetical protein
VSVSSTSSGSSGHASIWSNHSGNSITSIGTHYSHTASAPLPAPPVVQSPPPVPQQQQQQASNILVGSNVQPAAAPQAGWGARGSNYYWCTSCETRFKRKYDWKRHEEEFHERWKKYPCPEPGCNRSFWGANTFNQHHKASHGCKSCPHSDKVVRYLRKRKYWACGFCSALHPSRERHVEHVARHFESGKTKSDWMHSRVVYGLLHQPLIHEAWKSIIVARQGEHGSRQTNFSWHPNKTGRAQGFMENESPGQLQDLLEFFSGSTAEAHSIATIAFELADLVFLTPPPPPAPTVSVFSPTAVPPPYSAVAFPPQQHLAHPNAMQQPHSTPSPYAQHMADPSAYPAALFSPQHQPRTNNEQIRRSLDRDLPPPPPPEAPVTTFEFPNNMVFEDWASMASTVVDESAPPPTSMSPDWDMVQYYDTTTRIGQ